MIGRKTNGAWLFYSRVWQDPARTAILFLGKNGRKYQMMQSVAENTLAAPVAKMLTFYAAVATGFFTKSTLYTIINPVAPKPMPARIDHMTVGFIDFWR